MTTSIQTIEEMGYNADFFMLEVPEPDGQQFQYYTFAGTYRPELLDVWELIGVQRARDNPTTFMLRLMHIEEEMFEWTNFFALQHAQGRLSLDPFQTRALLEFFKQLMDEIPTKSTLQSFRLLNLDELRTLHVPEQVIHALEGYVYEYTNEKDVLHQQERCIVKFPRWSSRVGSNQVSSLVCAVFNTSQLLNPNFCPLYGFGVSTVTFSGPAFREFLFLLEEHSYEAFLQKQ